MELGGDFEYGALKGPDCVDQGESSIESGQGRKGTTQNMVDEVQCPSNQGEAGNNDSLLDFGESL